MECEHTIIVQFKNSGDIGTGDELAWRREQEESLGALLHQNDVGYCEGGQAGAGTMEIYLHVSDPIVAADLIIDYLTDVELIAWAKVVQLKPDVNNVKVLYPPNARFSIWGWDDAI